MGIEKLFKAIVHCFPPAGRGGRFRAGRFFSAGSQIVEGLSEKDIKALMNDVLSDVVDSMDRKTGTLKREQVKKPFFSVTGVEACGEREVPDPVAPALPTDRLPSAMELLNVIRDLKERLDHVESRSPDASLQAEIAALRAENAALKAKPVAPVVVSVVEPAPTPESRPFKPVSK